MKWLMNSHERDADQFQRDTQLVTVQGSPQPPPASPHTIEDLKQMGLVGIYTDDPPKVKSEGKRCFDLAEYFLGDKEFVTRYSAGDRDELAGEIQQAVENYFARKAAGHQDGE